MVPARFRGSRHQVSVKLLAPVVMGYRPVFGNRVDCHWSLLLQYQNEDYCRQVQFKRLVWHDGVVDSNGHAGVGDVDFSGDMAQ